MAGASTLVVAARLSGNCIAHINEVILCRARLVLRWMIVCGFSSKCGTFISVCDLIDPCQLSLAIPLWVGAVSTSQRAVMPCGCGVKAGMVRVWVAGKTV